MTAPHMTLGVFCYFLLLTAMRATVAKAAACSANSRCSIDDLGPVDIQGTSVSRRMLMQTATAAAPEPAPQASKAKSGKVNSAGASRGAGNSHHAQSPDYEIHEVTKVMAEQVTKRYVDALTDLGTGGRSGSFFRQFCRRFRVTDPVGTRASRSSWSLYKLYEDRKSLMWPEGYELILQATTIAQDFKHTAVFSSMVMRGKFGEDVMVNRTDLLKISRWGCLKKVHAYWSVAGSLMQTAPSTEHKMTEDAIRNYLTALHELGTNQSYRYFHRFTQDFTLRDPMGSPPVTSLRDLQTRIPELARNVAPEGFSVTVKGVTVAADPKYGSAHLVLHLHGGPSVDIIDVFKIKNGKVKNLKAVWRIEPYMMRAAA
mmetsp:Transcript_6239/g.11603  ORF Transcript_6239/g.11603 Transcript_6239/m.11603 type:complete len:371 (-) Transcript_6239:163-1275(-)